MTDSSTSTKASNTRWILLALAIVVLASIVFFMTNRPVEQEEFALPDTPPDENKQQTIEPLVPEKAPVPDKPLVPETHPVISAPPLPALDDSDPLALEHIANLAPVPLTQWIGPEHILRRSAAILSGLGDGVIHNKLLRLPSPKTPFAAVKTGENYTLDPDNYRRYDETVTLLINIPSEELIGSFEELSPLLNTAYAELGIPDRNLNQVINAALEQILSTPIMQSPPALELTSVTYTFADPEIESLPALQKLLIRMGPENTQKIQSKAREIQVGLLKKH